MAGILSQWYDLLSLHVHADWKQFHENSNQFNLLHAWDRWNMPHQETFISPLLHEGSQQVIDFHYWIVHAHTLQEGEWPYGGHVDL